MPESRTSARRCRVIRRRLMPRPKPPARRLPRVAPKPFRLPDDARKTIAASLGLPKLTPAMLRLIEEGISRYKARYNRERFLTSDELARLGDALREGETVGLP